MLRLLFSLVFLSIGLAIIYIPSITNGADANTRLLFGGLMLVYGSYRFFTFWVEFKKARKEEEGIE